MSDPDPKKSLSRQTVPHPPRGRSPGRGVQRRPLGRGSSPMQWQLQGIDGQGAASMLQKRSFPPIDNQWENVSKKRKNKRDNSCGAKRGSNPYSSLQTRFSTAGPSYSDQASGVSRQTKTGPKAANKNLSRLGSQRFRADYTITELVTIDDWSALAALNSPLLVLWKLQELESSWVKALHTNSSADILTKAFEIFCSIDDQHLYDRLGLMKSLFKNNFFTTIIKILEDLKTSWLSLGIPKIYTFLVNLRQNVKFLLLNDPAFHSDHTLKSAVDTLQAETRAFLEHLKTKLTEIQGKSDKRLDEELAQFEELSSIKSIKTKEVDESLFPDDFLKPYNVSSNIVQGSYQNDYHYAKTHFSLLKEDFQSVLREGVEQYLEDPRKKNSKIWVYENVVLTRTESRQLSVDSGKNCFFRVDFPECRYLSRIRWQFSQRFMYCSLVVLTSDRFNTYHLALVEHQDIEYTNLDYVVVKFVTPIPLDFEKKKFLLVEPKTFFGPYSHLLKVLKKMAKVGVPLKKYVINADVTPNIPAYLTADTTYSIDGKNIKINDPLSWPHAADLGLNRSQKSAFIDALTNEMTLIQGPPGTGKTYLAFKIIKALLANRNLSYQKGPILIICYKNHSLDQILSGLLVDNVKVRRIGSRTKNETLKYESNVRILQHLLRDCAFSTEKSLVEEELKSYTQTMKEIKNRIYTIDKRLGIVSLYTFKEFDVVDKQVELDLVAWLMEFIHVDTQLTMPTSLPELYTDTDFCSVSLESVKEDINIIIGLAESCFRDNLFDEHQELCYQYRFACEFYRRIQEGLTLETDSIACPDPKSPDFRFDDLDLEERWALYNRWERQLKSCLEEMEAKCHENLTAASERLADLKEIDLCEKLKIDKPAVIGATTTGAATHYAALSRLGPKIVLVEEAAEVLEAHVVSSLSTQCQHLIMIGLFKLPGDHQQLRPTTASMRVGSALQLNISLFERMINNGAKCSVLSTQHRMRPEIAELICPSIYPQLTNSPTVAEYPNVRGVAKNVFFFSHTHPEQERIDSESKFNPGEACMLLEVCGYLLQHQEYKADCITILSTYLEQDRYIKKVIGSMDRPGLWRGIKTDVVDNYQGEENTIVFLSLVRSNPHGSVGFLSTKNRVCVALSRAKHGLFIFGDMICLTKKEPTIWRAINEVLIRQESVDSQFPLKCERHGNLTKVASPADIKAMVNGGCNMACAAELACGHTCQNSCHGEDPGHINKFSCQKPCLRKCAQGHVCPSYCYKPCPECATLVLKTLDCGHTLSIPCHLPPLQDHCEEMVRTQLGCGHNQMVSCRLVNRLYEVVCEALCLFQFSCGHLCQKTCHSRHSIGHVCEHPCQLINLSCPRKHRCSKRCREPCGDCMVIVEKTLPCNHQANMPCSKDVSQYKCQEMCTRQLSCGHQCPNKCWEGCGPCPALVDKTIEECGHQIKVRCPQSPKRSDCISKCRVTKPCGHPCRGDCRTPCILLNCIVDVKTEGACGHEVVIGCWILEQRRKEDLFLICKKPCTTQLPCRHSCRGNCSDCWFGSLHVPCAIPCKSRLICGHRCNRSCKDLIHTCAKPECFETCWKELMKHVETSSTIRKGRKSKPKAFNPVNDMIIKITHVVEQTRIKFVSSFKGTEEKSKILEILRPLVSLTQHSHNIWETEIEELIFLKGHLFRLECGSNLAKSYNRVSAHSSKKNSQMAELKSMIERIAHVVAASKNVSRSCMGQLQDLILWVNCTILTCELSCFKGEQTAAFKLLSSSKLAFSQGVRSEFYSLIKDQIDNGSDFQATALLDNVFPLTLKWCSPIYHHEGGQCSMKQEKNQNYPETAIEPKSADKNDQAKTSAAVRKQRSRSKTDRKTQITNDEISHSNANNADLPLATTSDAEKGEIGDLNPILRNCSIMSISDVAEELEMAVVNCKAPVTDQLGLLGESEPGADAGSGNIKSSSQVEFVCSGTTPTDSESSTVIPVGEMQNENMKKTPWSMTETVEMNLDMAIPGTSGSLCLPAIQELPEDTNCHSSITDTELPDDDSRMKNHSYMDDID